MASRQRFHVELTDGETTIVSWKKLVSSAKTEPELGTPANAVVANSTSTLQTQIASAPAPVIMDPVPPVPVNRLTAVIERIEHLFKGEDSDDDNVDAAPAEDWYDTDDSFIDDEELDNYFVKDKTKTKHSGFFINRGALEKIHELPQIEVVVQPVKKKRAESKKKKATSALLEVVEVVAPAKERKLKEPGLRKKREPNGSKKKLVPKQEQDQAPSQNLETDVVEPKKRKRKAPTGTVKESKRNKKNPIQEHAQEPCLNLEIEDKR